MVRKYFLQQLGLLIMVSVIMVLTNILGYKMPVGDSIAGILVLCAIALFGLTVSKFMSQSSIVITAMERGSVFLL